MSIGTLVFAYCALGILLSAVLLVLFGQITVKKLRKNPNTKDKLGVEFISGWDIFNVAGALSLPRFLTNKMEKSWLSPMYANAAILIEKTTKFDRALAFVFYWLSQLSTLCLLLFMLFESLGVFSRY